MYFLTVLLVMSHMATGGSHLLVYLMLLELFLLIMVMYVGFSSKLSAGHLVMLFMVMGVGEASLGLALMVKLARSGFSEKLVFLSLLSV